LLADFSLEPLGCTTRLQTGDAPDPLYATVPADDLHIDDPCLML
jgi:hypothetical protein